MRSGSEVNIIRGGLDDARVQALLHHHVRTARAETGRGSAHAFDPEMLRAPEIEFFSAWDGEELLGVGALLRLSAAHGEIKSMHVAQAHRRRGVASALVRRLIAAARDAGMSRVSLETGAWPYFTAARELYQRHGFVECPPFEPYVPDPNSVFMTLVIEPRA